MENNTNSYYNKKMAELYLKLYIRCIKYKNEKDKEIQCDKFYRGFELFSDKK
jgi:hypothetical protein